MNIKTEALSHLKTSLKDIRCAGPIVDLEQLFVRTDDYGRRFARVFLEDLETPIKDIDELIAALSEDLIDITRPMVKNIRHVSDASSIRVVARNIFVKIDVSYPGDSKVHLKYTSGVFNLTFGMAYCNDNDTALPIKLLQILVSEVDK